MEQRRRDHSKHRQLQVGQPRVPAKAVTAHAVWVLVAGARFAVCPPGLSHHRGL